MKKRVYIFIGVVIILAFSVAACLKVLSVLQAEQAALNENIVEEQPGRTLLPQDSDIVNDVVFDCPGGATIHTLFYTSRKVALELSDGRVMTLPQTISASGARYANADESFVFWNKGDGAFVEEQGKIKYENCTIRPSGRSDIDAGQPFSETGVLVINNPGLTKNTPYLLYEAPGKPALSVQIKFDAASMCETEGRSISCAAVDTWPPFVGQRVHVTGRVQAGIVSAEKINVVK